MTEQWRTVPGWEGFYEVSSHGQVKSLARVVEGRPGVMMHKVERMLTISFTQDGYPRVWLTRFNKRTQYTVHRLVAAAFIGPVPIGHEVCHVDGIKTNNFPSNLRYGTRSENTYDKVRHGVHPFAVKTHCPQGHPYDEANTYRHPATNARGCRACRKAYGARRNRKVAA